MSSLMTSHHGEQSLDTHRSKRRKLDDTAAASTSGNQILRSSHTNQIRWTTSAEHQSYSAKLIAALRHVRRRNSSAISGGRELRVAADTALAMAAKGRTRWSRAIFTSCVKVRLTHRHKKARAKARAVPPPPPPFPPPLTAENAAATPIEKRVKVLGKLVPGCRKLSSFPNLLEEATDYIAALQLQVRTMAALAELLSGSTGSSGPSNIEQFSRHSNNVDDDNPV